MQWMGLNSIGFYIFFSISVVLLYKLVILNDFKGETEYLGKSPLNKNTVVI